MNTFQLSCFLAVAEYLNFAQAAKQLHVTHPAVSQQIQSLEKELNVKLFQRTTRSVKLTDEGKVFLWDAKQIVAISDRAKKRFGGVAGGNIETLSIGCYNFPCMFLLADTLETLRTIRPELHPRLQEIPFQHIYRMLEEGDLDAVVGFKESANVKINALYKEVAKVPMVCICSGSHSLVGKKELSLCDYKRRTPRAVCTAERNAFHCPDTGAAHGRASAFRILFLRIGRSDYRSCQSRIWDLCPAGFPGAGYASDFQNSIKRCRSGIFWYILQIVARESGIESIYTVCKRKLDCLGYIKRKYGGKL